MGTRSGDLDPSVVTYIAKYRNHTPDEMDEILNKKSGVYGISEVSVDFRDIEAEALEGNINALMALDSFAYNVAQFIASSLNPSEVLAVDVNEEEKTAMVVVPDDQLSLAIGKEGQNVRLAARLTGYRIDIKSESQIKNEILEL